MILEDRELTTQVARIDVLLQEIEALPDTRTRAKVAEIIQALLSLYGEGLGRLLNIVASHPDPGVSARALREFTEDELIMHLLVLHDLHPVDVETRVEQALEGVRPYLRSHGGNVELISVTDGIARIRLEGHCKGCPSSAMTLKTTVEDAVRKAAPELIGIEAESTAEAVLPPTNFVPISALLVQRQ